MKTTRREFLGTSAGIVGSAALGSAGTTWANDRTGKVTELPVPDADPRQWQPFRPGDGEFKPIGHRITWRGTLPAGCPPGWQQIGLWLPDDVESLRRDPRFAVRVANRDVPWWTDVRGQYGINVLGVVEVVS